jgi:hypothetical protein
MNQTDRQPTTAIPANASQTASSSAGRLRRGLGLAR